MKKMAKQNYIELFERLDVLAQRHGVTSVEWAEASHIPQPRITELRNLVKLHHLNVDIKTGRSCSFEKVHSLLLGLKKLLGEDLVIDELLAEVKREKDINKHIMLTSLIITIKNDAAKEIALAGLMKVAIAKDE